MVILLFSLVVARIFSMERIPQEITTFLIDTFKNPYLILLVVNAFLIVAGMVVDDLSVTVIISPLLLPGMVANGVHPVQFMAIVGTSVVIGANSPPTAPILYMACRIGEVDIHETIHRAGPEADGLCGRASGPGHHLCAGVVLVPSQAARLDLIRSRAQGNSH